GRTAEVIGQYLKKGRPIFIEGRLTTRSWEKDGAKQYRTEVIIENFQFGPGAPGEGGGSGGGGATRPAMSQPAQGGEEMDMGAGSGGDSIQYPDEEINPEDIPF
ncbi:MAG: single-stranded DNA-binding protein, partial [Parcubacteria group bacterium]|nr:single-stranded DNA-binding protein [Parcubacteria group bacterium]